MLRTATLFLPQQTFHLLEMIVCFTALNITHLDAHRGGTKQNNPEFREASPERWSRDQNKLFRNITLSLQPWLALQALLTCKIWSVFPLIHCCQLNKFIVFLAIYRALLKALTSDIIWVLANLRFHLKRKRERGKKERERKKKERERERER